MGRKIPARRDDSRNLRRAAVQIRKGCFRLVGAGSTQKIGINQQFAPRRYNQRLAVGQSQLQACSVLGNDLLAFLNLITHFQGSAVAAGVDHPGLAFQNNNNATRLSRNLIGSHGESFEYSNTRLLYSKEVQAPGLLSLGTGRLTEPSLIDAVYPQRQLQAIRDVEFGKYSAQMGFDGSFRDMALLGDGVVGSAIGRQNGNLNLPLR